MKDTLPVRVRFGAFELDLRSGELHEGNRVIRLQEKAFRLLQLLIEGGGQVLGISRTERISRADLRIATYPTETLECYGYGVISQTTPQPPKQFSLPRCQQRA